jgi:hypothetical protein
MYILCSLPFSAAPKGNLYSPSEIDAPAFLIVQFAIPIFIFLTPRFLVCITYTFAER